jgi:hypothetical protein
MRAQGEVVLTQFLQDLHDGRYLEAAGVYGGDYQALWEWNPGIPPDDRVSLLRSGCTNNGLQCYPVGRIVAVVHAEADEIVFLVELAVNADSTLVTGPCCGEGGPAESQFRFTVRRVGGRVVVMSLPPYAA